MRRNIISDDYAKRLLPGFPGDVPYKLRSYGYYIRDNKDKLNDAFEYNETDDSLRALFLAMGFQETTHLTSDERDALKDNRTDGSPNWSLWNLNEDMLRELGYTSRNFLRLNDDDAIPTVLDLMEEGVRRWGVPRFLAFVRGGRTGFRDGQSYDVYGFQNAICTHLRVLSKNKSLFWDDRRIDIDLKRV